MTLKQVAALKQSLVLNNTLQQSLKILQSNSLDLLDYLKARSLENPLFEVGSVEACTKEFNFDQLAAHGTGNLYDYLLEQVGYRFKAGKLQQLLQRLILEVEPNGYLKVDEARFIQENQIDQTTYQDVVTLLQQLDPIGVGGRDAQEVLLLQASAIYPADDLSILVITDYFEQLLAGDIKQIQTQLAISQDDMQSILHKIGALSLEPGNMFDDSPTNFQVPDVIIKMNGSRYQLLLTEFGRPTLIFEHASYAQFQKEVDVATKQYIQQKYAEYQMLNTSLHKRGQTLLMVAEVLIKAQWDYITGKQAYPNQLILRDIANQLQLSESTISRTIKEKSIRTPNGIYLLRSLLTKRSTTLEEGPTLTQTHIAIQTVVKEEEAHHPLSDQKIADQLKVKYDIEVARRTVAKYRQELGIANKADRK